MEEQKMEIVVSIPDKEYDMLKNRFNELDKSKQEWLINKILSRVADGAMLPKEHGDLIDVSEVKWMYAHTDAVIYSGSDVGRIIKSVKPVIPAYEKEQEPKQISSDVLIRLFSSFPGSFLNSEGEFIAHVGTNSYFVVKDCATETDVACKMLEWLSRDASKCVPYMSEEKNEKFRTFIRDGMNAFLGTNFSKEDCLLVYEKLGCALDHQKTVEFVKSGFDMDLLSEEREEER